MQLREARVLSSFVYLSLYILWSFQNLEFFVCDVWDCN